MICFPLDNTPCEAKDMGTYLATRTRGVFSSDGNLAVTPGESGLSVSVSPGLAWLKWSDFWGVAALQAQVLTLDLDTADGALKRIDAIVCRLDKVNNRAEIVVKKGAPSSAPIVVPPVRDANYDELYIATVLIGAGVISISASAITDQRLNEEYCGLMRDGVTGIPTASLHAQAQQILTELTDALNAQIVRQSAEFDAWFDDLKGKLGEDPATALQQQVDNLNAAVVGDAFQASGTPVSIAYAGTNRIASITAYGENAQGGTTEAPVALTGVDSVFVSGNNLLPKAVRTETTGGITFTPNPDGSILVSGTATTNVGYSYAHFERALLGRTVCLSGGSMQAQVLINERLSSGAFVRNVLVDRGQGMSGTLTKQKEDNILYATIQVLAGTTVNTTIYPMLNLGNTAMPYEPYQGSVTQLPIPRPLHKVGDVRDVCRTRVKSVYDKRIVLDGSEANLGYNEEYSTLLITGVLTAGSITETNVYGVCISSHFSSIPAGGHSTGKTDIIWSQPRLKQLVIHSPKFSSLETAKAYLSAQKAAGTPVTVYYQSTSCNGTNGLDVCLTEYQTGFVELDGTEDVVFDTYGNTQKRIRFDLDRNAIARYALKFSHGNPGDTPTVTGGISASFNRDVLNRLQIICSPDTWTALGVTDTATAKTWLAAQKAAGTPVQIAYQLATPETYATDPLDFDNAAGPLTVLTGGEVEVRMTELVGSRTYDADGDGVVDEAEKVSNALILKNAAGEVVATFDGSEAAILQLTAALVGALGKTEKAADSSKLAGLAPVVDNPGPNNRNTWYFPFTGTNNRDGTRKYYAALYADNATTAGRASNLSMGLNGTDLWVYYS